MNVADRSFNIVSLCSGAIDALALGVELAVPSARVVCHVERDAFCAANLVRAMEEGCVAPAPVFSDVRTFDGRPWRGVVDCVVAGIPCQGNSLAGKRLLADDPRDLWPATRRILRDLDCEWFLLENVYGFMVPQRNADACAPVARVLGELAEDGWDAEWGVFSAAEVGAPHQRERLFIPAHRAQRGLLDDGGPSEASARNRQNDGLPQPHNLDVANGTGGGFGISGQSPRRDGQPDGGNGALDHAQRPEQGQGEQG